MRSNIRQITECGILEYYSDTKILACVAPELAWSRLIRFFVYQNAASAAKIVCPNDCIVGQASIE